MEVKNLKEQIENLVKDELKLSNLVSNYSITIGIIKGKNKVRKTGNSKTITNADILYILENGSKLQNIPPRPVLDMTLQYAKYDKLEERIVNTVIDGLINKGWTDSNVENYIKMEAQELVNYTRDLINSNEGWLKANSYETAKRKWLKTIPKKERRKMAKHYRYPEGNHPLVDTGNLVNSITYKVEKK